MKAVYGYNSEGDCIGVIPVPYRKDKRRLTVRLAKKHMARQGAVSFKKIHIAI